MHVPSSFLVAFVAVVNNQLLDLFQVTNLMHTSFIL